MNKLVLWIFFNRYLDPNLRAIWKQILNFVFTTHFISQTDHFTNTLSLFFKININSPPKKEESESLELPKEIESKETKSLETPAEEKKDEKKKVNKNVKKK